MNRVLSLLLLTVAGLLLPGCRTFDREWRMWSPPDPAPPKGAIVLYRKVEPPPTPQSPFDGRWIGRWTSDKHRSLTSNGMESGKLHAIFTKIDPYRYRANFRAEWMLGVNDFRTELYGHSHGNELHLKGEAAVCRICGKYRYEGTVTPEHFTLHYDSSYDTGTFEMRKLH